MKEKVKKILKKIKDSILVKESNEDVKISFNDFIKYLKNNSLLVILTIVILFLCHGYLLFNTNVGIDTEKFITNPESNYNWYEIGRFGLVFEKYILNLGSFSMYYAEMIAMIFLILFNYIVFYAIYKFSGKNYGLINIVFTLICFTSSIWAEQFIFTLQMAEINFSLCLVAIANLFIYKWILEKNNLSMILSIILLVISFATYQSFIFIYIALCIFSFLLIYENKEINKNLKYFWKNIFKLIITFIVSFGIYELMLKFFPYDSSYLNGSNAWKVTFSRKQCLLNIFYRCKSIVLGEGIYYTKATLVGILFMLIIGIINSIKNNVIINKFNKLVYFVAYGIFITIPFLLTIYLGQGAEARTEIYIPIVTALSILYMIKELYERFNYKIVKYTFIIFVLVIAFKQSYYLESLYYTDKQTRDYDIAIARNLEKDMEKAGIPQGAKVFFYGHLEAPQNDSIIKGQMIGMSLFEFNHTMQPMYCLTTQNICYLLNALGYKYEPLKDKELIFDARVEAAQEDKSAWPNDDFATNMGDYWVVKINNY